MKERECIQLDNIILNNNVDIVIDYINVNNIDNVNKKVESCSYMSGEFKALPDISKVQFLNSGGARTKVLNIDRQNIEHLISLLQDLKELLR